MEMTPLFNKIHHADCLEFMKQLPDKCIDLVLTDRPYGIGMSKNAGLSHKYETKDWDNQIPTEDLFAEIFRISKNQIMFGGNYFNLPATQSWLVWDKRCGVIPERTFADGELAWSSFNEPLRIMRFIWDGMLQHDMKNKEERIHPTQKPRQLFAMILERYAKPGQIILDCFSGSGTTALACHDLGLDFICIEKDPDYHAASIKRLERHQKQLRLI
jgi:site-specific DNA-methyltransferase (adenine-specific)